MDLFHATQLLIIGACDDASVKVVKQRGTVVKAREESVDVVEISDSEDAESGAGREQDREGR